MKQLEKNHLTPEQRLERYTTKHPNYDHSNTDLTVKGTNNIVVKCPKHGEFTTTSRLHLTITHTCPGCKEDYKQSKTTTGKRTTNRTKWVEELNEPLTGTIDSNLVVTVSCPDHGHLRTFGVNESLPSTYSCHVCSSYQSHTHANSLMPDLKYHNRGDILFPDTTPTGNKLSYTQFTRPFPTELPIQIQVECSEHGTFTADFRQLALHKTNCPVCSKQRPMDRQVVVDKCTAAYGDRFDYSNVVNLYSSTKMVIRCKEHNKLFKVSLDEHLAQEHGGCKVCKNSHRRFGCGFKPGIPGILYYLSINGGQAYKIGITSLSVFTRYRKDRVLNGSYTILKTWEFDCMQKAYAREQEIIKQYESQLYKGDKLLDAGNTELFNTDVLQLDILLQ